MIIQFPVARETKSDEEYEKKLALIMPFADRPEAICQLLADCLVRLERLETAEAKPR